MTFLYPKIKPVKIPKTAKTKKPLARQSATKLVFFSSVPASQSLFYVQMVTKHTNFVKFLKSPLENVP